MGNEIINLVSGVIVEEDQRISFSALCRYCCLPAEQVISMVNHGIIEPIEPQMTSICWQFSGDSIIRVQEAVRLQRDLGINLPGTALVLELLDEVKALRQQVSSLQRG